MKLQYLAVIFVIIIMPISLVMSQYIQTQISTIVLQSSYTTNLTNATSGALHAFQINSINNRYSSLSDSKIRDIEASINTFYNLLSISMENYISDREELSTFIPAMLYTLYDGYYIYSSYNNLYKTTGDDGKKVTIQNTNDYQGGLRPYIYYSAKYKLANGKTIIVNYTLDNAITVYGEFKEVGETDYKYITKSGYLINPNYVTEINENAKTLKYNGVTIGPETLTEHLMVIENVETGKVIEGDYNYILYKNQKVYQDEDTNGNIVYEVANIPQYDSNGNIRYDAYGNVITRKVRMPKYFWYQDNKKVYLQSEKALLLKHLEEKGLASLGSVNASGVYNPTINFKSISAFEYYRDAKIFSEWVNEYLKDISQNNIVQNDGTWGATNDGKLYLSVDTGTDKIFNTKASGNDPLLSDSTFNTHRMAVIRKSIETNLTTAIANYNLQTSRNYEFTMPKIDEENWYNISNYVSLISFMQGLPIGTKYFNNYCVITNTKNEEAITDQSVYILTKDGNNIEYHKPGCEVLIQNQAKIQNEAYEVISMQRQTLKLSESNIRYFYPQVRIIDSNKNTTLTGCYNCIVNASGDYGTDSIISGEIKDFSTGNILYTKDQLTKIRTVYLKGLARERYDLYKTNFDLDD